MAVNSSQSVLENIITSFPPRDFRKKKQHVERSTDGGHQGNIIQLLVFEETNIKIYWYVKGDIDRPETEVNITFHTPINLDIGLFKHQLFLLLFRVKRLVDVAKKEKVCHS